jgi:hypothetical protein
MKEGELAGYWEWFRKDGTRMRSGYFENGNQVGEWTTYDAKGKIVKVTKMKSPLRPIIGLSCRTGKIAAEAEFMSGLDL